MNPSCTVLVTGAGGFVGRHLVRRLVRCPGVRVRTASRHAHGTDGARLADNHHVGNVDGQTDWARALEGCDCVVHLAARVHVLRDAAADPLGEFMRTNAEGTNRLAESAAAAGVRRFVFVSTIGVCGASTPEGAAFCPSSPIAPHDPYSQSKAAAEVHVRSACRDGGMGWTIVRPPMVYGREAPGNFGWMCRVLRQRIPLPLASVRNRRSIVAAGNLADLLACALQHPGAAGRVLMVCDGEHPSTPDLLRRAARAMGLGDPVLLPFPPAVLKRALRLAGGARVAARLLDSCVVDAAETRSLLAWSPPATLDEGLFEALA